MKAIILLDINAARGNNDCGMLRMLGQLRWPVACLETYRPRYKSDAIPDSMSDSGIRKLDRQKMHIELNAILLALESAGWSKGEASAQLYDGDRYKLSKRAKSIHTFFPDLFEESRFRPLLEAFKRKK